MQLTFEEFQALHNLLSMRDVRIALLEDKPLAFSRSGLAKDVLRKVNGFTPDQKRTIEELITDTTNGSGYS